MIALGRTGVLVTRPPSSRAIGYVSNRDVYLSVTLAWVLAALLGGVSFSLYYLLHSRRRFDVVLDREVLWYVAIIVASVFFV